MLAQLWSAALHGLDAYPVRVETDVGPGLPAFSTVGLPDMAVRESRERVVSALRNSGMQFPLRRITINLAPADRRKEGSAFDLPMALGILGASGQMPLNGLAQHLFLGELSLDGTLRPLRGAFALAQAAGCGAAPRSLMLPRASAAEASLCGGFEIVGVDTLAEAVAVLSGRQEPSCTPAATVTDAFRPEVDLEEVRGQAHAKRALEIAAAGGHNLFMTGPPGAGKTMLARALPGILPPLSREEALEATRVHSVAGLLGPGEGLLARRPFRAPHHTVSDVGLVGGGRPVRPGEISLAHRGVLFLDEMTEFPSHRLELLRQPLEEGRIVITRAAGTLAFPARFMLIAAANPCACGQLGSGDPRRPCRCTPGQLEGYRARISGPMMDRIDLEVAVPAVPVAELTARNAGVPSAVVGARVEAALARQIARWISDGVRTNAEARPDALLARGAFTLEALSAATRCVDKFALSARGFHRLLRVARTVADLSGNECVQRIHVAEAAAFRGTTSVRCS